MNHRRTRERLSGYLEGELRPRERDQVRTHLDGCDACRAELDALTRVIALVRRLPEPEAPPALSAAVLRNLPARSSGPLAGLGGWLRDALGGNPLSPLAAAAIAAGLVVWVQLSPPETAGPALAVAEAPRALASAPAAPAANQGRRLVGAVADPGTASQPIPRHFAECRTQGTDVRECEALYYAWLMAQAHEDPPGFARAASALPRQRFDRLHRFASDSGSAPWVWRSLRDAGEPGAQRLATQLVQPASARR